MSTPLSVVIPVANEPRYLELLPECLTSLVNQSVWPDEVVLVLDGMTKDDYGLLSRLDPWLPGLKFAFFSTPCRVGVASAYNIGVAIAQNNLVLMMGCDDLLKPRAIEHFTKSYEINAYPEGFIWVDIEWEDGTGYSWPCGHGLTTKSFWKWLGGYPLEASGACDSALLAMLSGTEWLLHLPTTEPQIIVRRDPTTYTGSRDPRWTEIIIQQCHLLGIKFRERNGLI